MIATDGKVILDRQQLKRLRRQLGISQEQLAFQCAERSLCVSVASIKRAETSKNILYRTARDIARFYQVDVNDLIANQDGLHENTPLYDYIIRRQLALLRCCWSDCAVGQQAVTRIAKRMEDLTQQYRVQRVDHTHDELMFVFGAEGSHGTQALQAAYFAFGLLRLICEQGLSKPLCLLASAEIASDQDKQALTEYPHIFLDTKASILFKDLFPGMVIVDDYLKPQLESRFLSQPLKPSSYSLSWKIQPQTKVWQPSLFFVGRRVELLQFRAILDSTVSFSTTHVICLNGSSGIGKSRLLHEYSTLAEAEGLETHLLSILDFGDQQSHQLIPQLTRVLLGLPPGAAAEKQWMQVLSKCLDDETQLPIALTMLGWPLSIEQNCLLSAIDHHVLSERQIQLIVTLLYRQASLKPLLIMIEDLHWADEKSIQFLFGLLQSLADLPVIFVLTYRPEASLDSEISRNNGTQALTTINLVPLDKRASTELANQFFDLDSEYREQCIDKSQGNPLFLEYLLRNKAGDRINQLPFSLQALLVSCLELLSVSDRQAVLAAAVLGQRFSIDVLLSVIDCNQYDPQALIDKFLLVRKGGHYQFNHALIHDGIYQSIIERDRCQLHHKCAKVYLDIDLPLAIKHFHRARSYELEKYLIPAIREAAEKFQYATALELIEIGRQVDYAEINYFSLYLWHAEILAKLGRISQSIDIAREAERVNASAGQKIQTLILQANGLNTLDDFPKALECIEAAEKIANKKRLLNHLAKIYYLKGNFYFPRGDVDACYEYHQKSLTYAKKIEDPELQASALGGLGDAAYAKGKMYSAYDYLLRCLALCREYDLPAIEAPNLFMLGTVRIYQNQFHQALQDALRAIELAKRVGLKRAEIVARLTAAWIYLDNKQLKEAEVQIRRGLDLAHLVGAKRFVPFLEESQARFLDYSGDRMQAQKLIAAACDKVDTLNAHSFIGPWLLGTRALLSDDERMAELCLSRGRDMLKQGCIGHNYFRFHVMAMEYGLRHGNQDLVKLHQQALYEFTAVEPTPWSAFYLDRARFLVGMQNGESMEERLLQSLLQQGKDAGLRTAMAAIVRAGADGTMV